MADSDLADGFGQRRVNLGDHPNVSKRNEASGSVHLLAANSIGPHSKKEFKRAANWLQLKLLSAAHLDTHKLTNRLRLRALIAFKVQV